MNEIDHLLTGSVCDNPCQQDSAQYENHHYEPRYVRWEECAMMRNNFKNRVNDQFEKVDKKIEGNYDALEKKIDAMNKELSQKIDDNYCATDGKLDLMNTNLLGVSNSLVIAAFSVLGAVIVAIVGFYLILK